MRLPIDRAVGSHASEPVERLVEWPFDLAQGRELVERQMGVFRQPQSQSGLTKSFCPG
jgi:hypothetical protein